MSPLSPPDHPQTGIGGALARFVARLACAYKRQRLRDELMELDDHLLRDVGIARSDIPFIVSDAFAGAPRPAQRLTGGATIHRLADGCTAAPEAAATGGDKPLAA